VQWSLIIGILAGLGKSLGEDRQVQAFILLAAALGLELWLIATGYYLMFAILRSRFPRGQKHRFFSVVCAAVPLGVAMLVSWEVAGAIVTAQLAIGRH
jgi:hypothetical protein